jgi:hypothetical protein
MFTEKRPFFNVKRKLNELLEKQMLVRYLVHIYDGEEEYRKRDVCT